MILLPLDLRVRLRANAAYRACPEASETGRAYAPVPLVKFFNPLGAATWLTTELADDGDTLFGLADLGFGCPELGAFSLAELSRLRLPFGLRIERDAAFASAQPLSVWARVARQTGSILQAESQLRHARHDASTASPLPSPIDHEGPG